MFSYACNLLKMDASSADLQQCFKKYLPRNPVNASSYISLPSKLHHKIHRNKADFSSIEIRSKKKSIFRNFDISLMEVTSNKVRRNDVDFLLIKNTSKKVLRNDINFSPIEITSKKYFEMTWKFIHIFFWPIDVISTSNWRRFDVVCLVCSHLD